MHEYGKLNIKNSENYCKKKKRKKAVQGFQNLQLVGGGQHINFLRPSVQSSFVSVQKTAQTNLRIFSPD